LIADSKVLEGVLAGVKFNGAHYVFETQHRLPRLAISLFAKSNGVVIKVGDASHPSAVEVIASYPDWAERNERLLGEIREFLHQTVYEKNHSVIPSYVT